MKKRPPGQGRKSVSNSPKMIEDVFAFYCVKQNYSATAREFGLPVSTVFSMVNNRAGGAEQLESIRNAMRADMIEEAFAKARDLLPAISPNTCGSKATSATADASRAFESLVRAGHLMTPDAGDKDVAPPVINVYTGMKPPPELEAETRAAENVGPNTTSTAKENG